ncbi:hypothetical protein EZV62_011031 [Acer yangbiense]|uniref:Uncharacterized protein n=1 Tax=Acer yangbiense TaxID=1000413 RepID=A0A5C7I445_9ROSI|nr:hypothetical protein EZV62_011031 [Acer yangbiense]
MGREDVDSGQERVVETLSSGPRVYGMAKPKKLSFKQPLVEIIGGQAQGVFDRLSLCVDLGPVEVHSSVKQKSNKETFLVSSLRDNNVNQVESNKGEAFLSSSDEELVQDSVEVERNFVPIMHKNLLRNSDSLEEEEEEEEELEHNIRMTDYSSDVVVGDSEEETVGEVEEVENCVGSFVGDGEEGVVVVNSAGRIVGDSEEELVRVTIVVKRKHGKSRVKSGKEAIRSKHVSSKIRKCKHRLKMRNSKSLGVELFQLVAVEVERKRGVALDEIRKASKKQCWWEAPIDELGSCELEQLRIALEEPEKKPTSIASSLFIQYVTSSQIPSRQLLSLPSTKSTLATFSTPLTSSNSTQSMPDNFESFALAAAILLCLSDGLSQVLVLPFQPLSS